jgi:hypothetical protein
MRMCNIMQHAAHCAPDPSPLQPSANHRPIVLLSPFHDFNWSPMLRRALKVWLVLVLLVLLASVLFLERLERGYKSQPDQSKDLENATFILAFTPSRSFVRLSIKSPTQATPFSLVSSQGWEEKRNARPAATPAVKPAAKLAAEPAASLAAGLAARAEQRPRSGKAQRVKGSP